MLNKKLVTSLKLSKRLDKLGIKQESIFSWFEDRQNLPEISYFIDLEDASTDAVEICSAFLSDELGEMLPKRMVHFPHKTERDYGKGWDLLIFEAREGIWRVEYVWRGVNHYEVYHNTEAKTLAEAMGKMLVYLKENKLIDVI